MSFLKARTVPSLFVCPECLEPRRWVLNVKNRVWSQNTFSSLKKKTTSSFFPCEQTLHLYWGTYLYSVWLDMDPRFVTAWLIAKGCRNQILLLGQCSWKNPSLWSRSLAACGKESGMGFSPKERNEDSVWIWTPHNQGNYFCVTVLLYHSVACIWCLSKCWSGKPFLDFQSRWCDV